jgi:hypothetical protein
LHDMREDACRTCAEQAGLVVVTVPPDAAAARHAVRDVVASVRTSRPLASP